MNVVSSGVAGLGWVGGGCVKTIVQWGTGVGWLRREDYSMGELTGHAR